MGVRPVGQGSPKGRPRSGGRGDDFVGPPRSEGEAKWWDPTVLDASAHRPSEWDNREPGPSPAREFEQPKKGPRSVGTGPLRKLD